MDQRNLRPCRYFCLPAILLRKFVQEPLTINSGVVDIYRRQWAGIYSALNIERSVVMRISVRLKTTHARVLAIKKTTEKREQKTIEETPALFAVDAFP